MSVRRALTTNRQEKGEKLMVTTAGKRVAVVTGGTAGVGRATVRELANRGYDVAILARGAAALEGAAADVRKAGRWRRRLAPLPHCAAENYIVLRVKFLLGRFIDRAAR
jgi:NAD(P)-dependent dehydrogenase (short-subunit alcohol dehydrogenase family)